MNLVTYVLGQHVSEGRGNDVALVTPEGLITFDSLWVLSLKAAGALATRGVQRGDRVVIALHDGLNFVTALFGTLAAGGVVVMTNPEAPIGQHQQLAHYVGASVMLEPHNAQQWQEDVHNSSHFVDPVAIDSKDDAFWLLTSGSTGAPKAAMHRHEDFIAHIETYAKGVLGMTRRDRTMAVSKLHFPYATGMNLLFPLAVGGSAVVFPQRASAQELLRLAEEHKPTIFSTVPTMTARLLARPSHEQSSFRSLRFAVSAGEALPADQLSRWNEVQTVPLLDGIGSAEMFHVYITNKRDDVRPNCLGVCVPGYETRVVGEDGSMVGANEIGLLHVRGPSAAHGYHDDPDRSSLIFLKDGWVVTGDMFRKTAEGYHHYEGRSDDLLKVAGLYVSPLEVEAVLREHPAVKDCAVVGHADEHGLVKPRAFLVLEPGYNENEELWQELAAFARERLLGYKVPKWWVSVVELPRNDRGKVMRRILRDNFITTPLETHTHVRA